MEAVRDGTLVIETEVETGTKIEVEIETEIEAETGNPGSGVYDGQHHRNY